LEWETAAATRKGYAYPWGDRWEADRCNTETSAISDTSPVDHYPASENAYGLADLLGNVLEWTADACRPPAARKTKAEYHIAKGGSWISDNRIDIHTSARFEVRFTANILGFRLACDTPR
jgi:formylglycine-generating enzyme required for sulfatase activity